MVEVIKLFKQIQETSSLNDKKVIITANKHNELFKKCLKFLLDRNVITGISDAKFSKSVGNDFVLTNDTWEGVMLNLYTPYECKRTKNLIKVKKFFSCDIKCTGIEEGSGRNKGTLGALICDYKGNTVNVGTGFSDKDRKQIWQHPEDVINKIITVKYKEETKNKDGGLSIQFPVFETVRFDKNEPSYN